MDKFDVKSFLEQAGPGKTLAVHRAGTVIVRQGSEADFVYYLVSGRAKEVVTDRGKDAVLGMLEAGLFFGTGALNGQPHRSTVTALSPCVVNAIERDVFVSALEQAALARLFMAYLLGHTTKIEAEKVDLLLNSSEKRLAQRLLTLSRAAEGSPQVIGPEITQETLAEMIGTTRPRVNYFLNRFRELGMITYSGGIRVEPGLLKLVLAEKDER